MIPRLAASVVTAVLLVGCSSSDGASSDDAASTTSATTEGSTATSVATDPTDPATTPAPSTTAPSPSSTVSSSSSTTTAPSSTTVTADAPSTTIADENEDELTDAEASDRERARGALITLAVFPDGWIEEPVEDEEDDPTAAEFEADFDECLGRDSGAQVGDQLDRLKVMTGEFHPADSDSTTVSHEVVLAPDVDTALAAMAEVRVDGAEQCLADVIGAFYETSFAADPDLAEVGIGDVIVTRTETERDPDLVVGVMLEVPLTIGDQTVSQFLELLYQRQGRALSELSFSSFGSPFDRDGYTVLSDEAIIRIATIGN